MHEHVALPPYTASQYRRVACSKFPKHSWQKVSARVAFYHWNSICWIQNRRLFRFFVWMADGDAIGVASLVFVIVRLRKNFCSTYASPRSFTTWVKPTKISIAPLRVRNL